MKTLLLFAMLLSVCVSAKELSSNAFRNSSVFDGGRWVKVKTTQRGMHKITYEDLRKMGFENPDDVNLYGNGGFVLSKMNSDVLIDDVSQNSVWKGKDGSGNDCLFFYTPGTVRWKYDTDNQQYEHEINGYSRNECFYFLSEDIGSPQIVQLAQDVAGQPNVVIEQYDCYSYYEEEKNNLLESGRLWFGEAMTGGNSQEIEFNFSSRVPEEPLFAEISAAGRSSVAFIAGVKINGQTAGELQFSPSQSSENSKYADSRSKNFEYVGAEDKIEIEIQNRGNSSSQTWINYIRLNTRCRLNMSGSQFCFRDSRSVSQGNISEFRIGNASSGFQVWDVTDHLSVMSMPCSYTGQNLSFVASTDTLKEFVVFNPAGDIPTVEVLGEIENQNIHATGAVEMLIVTHHKFQDEANRLAQFHRDNDGMSVAVALTSQIYNEFSSGIPDVAAIRNYVRMCYSQSVGKLKYLLLFGNGTYDNVNEISESNPNYIPTWQSEESLIPASSFVSDDFFGLLDTDEGEYFGAVDVGVGRIPCVSQEEASVSVDKIVHYVSPECIGEWRNVICFVADDEDGNIHVRDAEKLAEQVDSEHPEFVAKKIYFDAFVQETSPEERYPEVTSTINDQIREGALIVNYTGHANDAVLAHEKVLTIDDIDAWTNYDRMPVFVTATCEFGRWDYRDKRSAGEHVLLNSNGGGIALFTTSRLVYSSSNYNMNKKFFEHAFEDNGDGERLRLGDVIRLAKVETGGGVNSRKFALLGDPALKLSYPEYNVKTQQINGTVAEQFTDTLEALNVVVVSGEVQDENGNKLVRFSGELFAVVYDKAVLESTLGNDGLPFEYTQKSSTLFMGDVTVEEGGFSFSFIVPKDIDYSVGDGEIRYYANSSNEDASGYHSFKIGGSSDNIITDNRGPQIELYLGNENFLSGDRVHENPLVLAYITDETGINTASVGIGHDITLIVNNNDKQPLVVNDFFRYDTDSYKSGKIHCQLFDMPEGENLLRLKVWDVLNNSSFVEIEFVVASELTVEKLMNYPNPMRDETYFSFEHNRYDELLNVRIEIYDLRGTLLDLVESKVFSNGNKIEPILWTPAEHGLSLDNGIYIYRVSLTTEEGLTVSSGERLLVLK
jgi:hypothetical protein